MQIKTAKNLRQEYNTTYAQKEKRPLLGTVGESRVP
jgi:hypothetical protein